MRKITITTGLFLASAISTLAEAQTLPATTNHAGMAMPAQSGLVTTVLSGTLGSRSASGSATLNGKAVQLVWSGDTPGSMRMWSVRSGACSTDGSIVGATSGYSAITADAKGNGTASATLSGPLNLSDAFHIAVYASSDVAAERIACGSLSSGPAVGESRMAGMDHSKMPGMDHSRMAGMDSGMAGMDHSGMKDSAMPSAAATSAKMSDSASAILLSIQQRMMEDPVIRERVMTDPTLHRLMEQLSGMGVAPAGTSLTTTMSGMRNTPAAGVKRSTATPPKKSTVTAPAKPVVKAPAKAPAMSPMPGMDHSTMPGMKKPPA